ncbi:DUF397 domain-containing protein [Nocardiopsis sp. NPDC007018]|uniref:DUF397 domain-containing protein n=1 Tax=Nocardiopsis sp. NPDC007018 TaxID=3155721 RepID=UPI0033FD92A7
MTQNPFDDGDFFTSGGSGDDGCVEAAIADRIPDLVGLRDSKNTRGPVLLVHPSEWVTFTRSTGSPACSTTWTSTSGTPLRSKPFNPSAADCDNCRGSGWIFPGGDGQGPWKDKEPMQCPLCKGKGRV